LLHDERTVEPQALSVETNAGTHWIGVTAEIASGPLLQIDQSTLDFGTFENDAERALSLTISNMGHHLLTGRVTSRVPWLKVPRGEFRCASGTSVKISIHAMPRELPRAPQSVAEALIIDSDGGQEYIGASASRIRPEMDLGTTHMDFGLVKSGEVIERYLYIGNTGNGPLRGTARSLLPWLQVYPQEITCETGKLVQLTATLDCVGLADGAIDIPQALRVQTNGGTRTLSLRLQVSAPMLSLEVPQLDFGPVALGETGTRDLIICNDGSAPLEATIHPLVNWLTVSRESVRCEPHSKAPILVSAHTETFEHGQSISLDAAIRVISGSDIKEIPASIDVIQPALRIEPLEIDFSYISRTQPETRTITIANEGTGNLAWNVQTNAVWLEVSPGSGICEPGQTQELVLTAYGLALESDSQITQETLIINSDGGRAKVPLRVALESPLIATDTPLLDLGTSVNRKTVGNALRIFNHGLGLLRGTINTDQAWLVVDHTSFECAMGRSIELNVRSDMDEFPRDESRGVGIISIESNGGEVTVRVTLDLKFAPCIDIPERVQLSASDPERPPQGRLVIKNSGMATAHIELDKGTSQLELSRQMCDIKPSKSVRITVRWQGAETVDPTSLYVDVRTGDEQIRVPIRLEKEATISTHA